VNEALVLLVLLWAVLLVPSALRSRASSSPHVTVGGFERAMDVLRTSPRTGGRQLLVPADAGRIVARAESVPGSVPGERGYAPRAAGPPAGAPPNVASEAGPADPVGRRVAVEDPRIAARRVWFVRLLVGTAASLLLAIIVGGLLWVAAFLAIAATAGYATLLRRLKLQRDEVRTVVRSLEIDADPRVPVGAAVGHDVAPSGSVRLRRWDG
jgi:hypothetical protein